MGPSGAAVGPSGFSSTAAGSFQQHPTAAAVAAAVSRNGSHLPDSCEHRDEGSLEIAERVEDENLTACGGESASHTESQMKSHCSRSPTCGAHLSERAGDAQQREVRELLSA